MFPDVDQLLEQLDRSIISADDLVRFRDDDGDIAVAGVVHSVGRLDDAARSQFRSRVTEEGTYTLQLFATRRVVKGRKQSSLELLHDAIAAYSLLPFVDDIPWRSWLLAALVLAAPLGEDPDDVVALFGGIDTAAGVRCAAVIEAVDHTSDLEHCHLIEVTTTYGLGLLELPVPHDVAASGLYGAPLIDHNDPRYQPTCNLAQAAVQLADAMERSPQVATGAIGYGQLAAQYFSLVVAGSWLPTKGCLRFTASIEGGGSFDVFVAEMDDEVDTGSLERAAVNDDGQAAFVEGRRLVLMSPQPRFDGVANRFDFGDLEALARGALRGVDVGRVPVVGPSELS